MPYHYTLLKWDGSKPKAIEYAVLETLEALQKLVADDIGFTPGWLLECSKDEYLGVEDEQGDFILDIEGAEVV